VILGFIPGCLFILVAQTTPAADTYAAGMACYEQLDYQCAIELLGAAAREDSGGDPARLVDIYRKLADSHLALGRREEAVADFIKLLRLNREYRIETAGTSPKILDAFGEARERLKKEEMARLEKKSRDRVRPPPEPWMEVGFNAGAEFLFGNDADLLETGAAFDVEATFVLAGPWRVGGGLRYTFHDLAENDSTMHLAGGWAAGGASLKLGPLHTQLLFGVGLARFGILDQEGKTGLLLPIRLTVTIPVSGDLNMGLAAAPGWLVTMESDPKSSFTMSVGGRISMVF
jgi:tetratricopeptide (TPR) repeat protein